MCSGGVCRQEPADCLFVPSLAEAGQDAEEDDKLVVRYEATVQIAAINDWL